MKSLFVVLGRIHANGQPAARREFPSQGIAIDVHHVRSGGILDIHVVARDFHAEAIDRIAQAIFLMDDEFVLAGLGQDASRVVKVARESNCQPNTE